jgi:hypothetical protein
MKLYINETDLDSCDITSLVYYNTNDFWHPNDIGDDARLFENTYSEHRPVVFGVMSCVKISIGV